MAFDIKPWMRDELERRKDMYRRLFAGEPFERLPVEVRPRYPVMFPLTPV